MGSRRSCSPIRWFAVAVLILGIAMSVAPASAQAESDDADFVRAAYDGLLGREPEPEGLAFWVSELERGVSRSVVVAEIGDAEEQRRHVVTGIYADALDRRPDPAGLRHWAGELIDRISARELRREVLASAEFHARAGGTDAGFVDELYARVLGRDAEPAGREFWVDRLEAGVPRAEIAAAFLDAPESVLRPSLSITETLPPRGIGVDGFDRIDVTLDRTVLAGSSALIVAVGGERIDGRTEGIDGRSDGLRFVPTEEVTASSPTPTPVVVTVFADDGTRVRHVDYRFDLVSSGSTVPDTDTDPDVDPVSEDLMVAFYGHPATPLLGIAGEGTPEEALARLVEQAAPYEASGRPVVPVFEMIATLVTANPGPDELYRSRADESALRGYLDAIRTVDGRMILDIQPGRADVLDEARAFEDLLREPDVGLALDPEWVVGPTQTPAGRVGSLDAADINRVSAYLAELAAVHDLPDRILIVHRFTPGMVTNPDEIVDRDGVRIIFHADGEGSPAAKIADYDTLMPPRFERGFKIFYDEDVDPLSPADVLGLLDPLPAFVSYQ